MKIKSSDYIQIEHNVCCDSEQLSIPPLSCSYHRLIYGMVLKINCNCIFERLAFFLLRFFSFAQYAANRYEWSLKFISETLCRKVANELKLQFQMKTSWIFYENFNNDVFFLIKPTKINSQRNGLNRNKFCIHIIAKVASMLTHSIMVR